MYNDDNAWQETDETEQIIDVCIMVVQQTRDYLFAKLCIK